MWASAEFPKFFVWLGHPSQPLSYVISISANMLNGVIGMNDVEKRAYYREVLRHELLHCIFAETGVEKWEEDEELVTYLSKIYPKMQRIFSELGCAS